MPVATVITEPERHALVMPEDCDCGMCTPTWARRRGKSKRFSEPVTLADALARENPAARPAMVAQHCACLTEMTSAISRETAAEDDELGSPELGLPLVLFAGELAAALQPGQFRGGLPGNLVQVCEQTVTTATLAAAGCLVGLVETLQAFSALAG
jgi:cytochrome c1